MQVRLYTNKLPNLGDKLTVSFVDETGTGEIVVMAKVDKNG